MVIALGARSTAEMIPLPYRRAVRSTLRLLLLCSIPSLVDAQTSSTSSFVPLTTPLPTNFQGYYFGQGTSIQEIYCGDEDQWVTRDNWGDCFPTTQTDSFTMLTYCVGTSAADNYGNTGSCVDGQLCQSMTVFEKARGEDGGSHWVNYFCADSWAANSVYRAIATTTDSSSSSSTSTTPSSTPSNTGTPTPTPEPEPGKSSSKAWIAGVVVGVVAIIGLFIAAVWFLRRRYARSANGGQGHQPVPVEEPMEAGKVPYDQGYHQPSRFSDYSYGYPSPPPPPAELNNDYSYSPQPPVELSNTTEIGHDRIPRAEAP